MPTGLHHVTSITADVQANVDFYMDFLGLSLVKQTAGFEDGEQLHLFYGNKTGAPGTLLSFLVWQDAGRGRTGIGQASEVALSVAKDTLGDWLTKALSHGLRVEGPKREFGETVLRLKDPDGLILKLVASEEAEMRLHSVTFLSEKPQETAEFVARFGYAPSAQEGETLRLRSQTDFVDIRSVAGFVPSIPGAGVPDHVAFRAPDSQTLAKMRLSLKDYGPTSVHDRSYFLSLYVREPSGTLIEYATDAPGMSFDETPATLGQTLKFPPHEADRIAELRVVLPQFARPGEARVRKRDLPFVHRLYVPEDPDGSTLILLHGSGGSETDLMPFAQEANPRATLIGVRGRAMEEGKPRWFRRLDFRTFDQADIDAEVQAFEAFVQGAIRGYGLEPARTWLLGHSNGANFASAVMRLKPNLVCGAVLLRPQEVMALNPEADLSPLKVLILEGERDLLVKTAVPLAPALEAHGAQVDLQSVPFGHEIDRSERAIVGAWLARQM